MFAVATALLVLTAASASEPFLVKDVYPGPSGSRGSAADDLTESGGLLFFPAEDGATGFELWSSDGTETGTVLVKDIDPGPSPSFPSHLTNSGRTLFFSAHHCASRTPCLWKSDGTETGTVLVKDIRPSSLADIDGTLYLFADDGTTGYELWKSDGTPAGTVLVKDINPGPDGSGSNVGVGFGGKLFFAADDGTGTGLWRSDGTEAGTVLVKEVVPGSLAVVGETLFFNGYDGMTQGLWMSDGTAAGTAPVKEGISASGLVEVGGALLFWADDGVTGRELWRSDGTPAGTMLVKDINPGPNGSISVGRTLSAIGGTLFFQAQDGLTGFELWKSDGTAAGTVLVKDINPGPADGIPLSFVNDMLAVGNTLFFRGDDGTTGKELWTSDGMAAGTVLVEDINPGPGDGFRVSLFGAVGHNLFFRADDGTTGSEMWALIRDADGDGVTDEADLCDGTVLPDVPTHGLRGARFAAQPDGTFDSGLDMFDGLYSLVDTAGCSGVQIIEQRNLGLGHLKFGISKGELEAWIANVEND